MEPGEGQRTGTRDPVDLVPPRVAGCSFSVLGLIGFLVSPLWAVAATAGLPAGQQDQARELYLWGTAVGAVVAALLFADAWHFARNLHRKPLPRHVVWNYVIPLGYATSLWIERTVSGTVWGPFLIGVFGLVSLAFVFVGLTVREERRP